MKRLTSDECDGDLKVFEAVDVVEKGYENDLEVLRRDCSGPEILQLRVNAQVVHLINSAEDILVNGSRGVITRFDDDGFPVVSFVGVGEMTIFRHTWEYKPDPHKDFVSAKRCQLPLKLAWALSIHKSQGMSLDKVDVDISNCFENGQAYVALSRCTTLSGLRVRLPKKVKGDKLFCPHPKAVEFDASV
jgi:ATP-dependent DNA helicase PIF1